jgi:aspartate dehydrogenase
MRIKRKHFSKKKVKIGIVGCGAIGEGVAKFLDREFNGQVIIWALADNNINKAAVLRKKIRQSPKILDVDSLLKGVDLIIEAASQDCAEYLLKKAVALKKDIIILSVGALIKNESLLKQAEKKKVRIYVPSGAICGIDGLGALSLGKIEKICLITSKNPVGFLGVEYLKREGIDLLNIKKEKVIFEGGVKEAIKYFPKNINVAATLLLASATFREGISLKPGKIKVYIKVNPALKRNVHRIEITAKEANVSINIENVPLEANPKTSTLAVLSTQYLLRKIFSSFKIGS